MSASYTRKGTFTLANIKSLLGINALFADLTDAQKNSIVNSNINMIAAKRNDLGKDDYKFDTAENPDVLSGAVGFENYIRLIAISAGTTYNSTFYPTNTILTDQKIPSTLSYSANIAAGVLTLTTSDIFDETVQVVSNQPNWLVYDTTDPDAITFDVGSGWGVLVLEIFQR